MPLEVARKKGCYKAALASNLKCGRVHALRVNRDPESIRIIPWRAYDE